MIKKASVSVIACAVFGLLGAVGKDVPEYTALESAKHIGETATVTDKVDDVYQAKGGSVFLHMGGKHPNESFTVFIPTASASAFSDFKVYEGKTITVSGKIEEHQGKPEIVVKSPAQITSKVDDLSGATSSSPASPIESR
jgi:DNA/RNA endonuclease YhcR with UshA esterase domain